MIYHEVVGDGPPLVLLNGIMMTTQSWAPMLRRGRHLVGGEFGMLFAAARPSRVRKLVVIACVAEADEALRERVGRWIDVARHEPSRLYEATVHDNFSEVFLTPRFIELGSERLRTYPPKWFEAFAEFCEAALTLRVPLAGVRAPMLVICGEDDALKPVAQSRPGAGHAVVIEKPGEICALIEKFL